MGNILPFPPRHGRTTSLGTAESVCLLAVRWWVADLREGCEPLGRLRRALAAAEVPAPGAEALDQFLRFLARGACRQIEVHAPCCPCLAADERLLLQAAALAQIGAVAQAAAALSDDMMAPPAAELAAGPLAYLGVLLGTAGLYFPPGPTGRPEVAAAPLPRQLH